jgi:peptidoglycan/LPS O-acetylase OafA/YrhL
MRGMRRRDSVLISLVISLTSGLLMFVIGPNYLQALPIGTTIAVAVACAMLIAAIAVYARRRRPSEHSQKG